MNFVKGVSITGLTTFLISIIAFLNNVIVTRQIGPEGRGQYSVLTNLIMFMTLILGEGIRRSNTILVGRNVNDLKKIININILYGILVTFMMVLLYLFRDFWLFLIPNIKNSFILITFFTIIFGLIWQAFQAIYLGLKKYYEFNIIQLIPIAIGFIINFFGIILFNFQLKEILLSLLLSSILSFLYGLYFLKDKFRLKNNFSIDLLKEVNDLTFKSTFSAGLIFILIRSNIFLINYFLGAIGTGIYSIAYIFLDLTQKLPNVVTPILISRNVSDSKKNAVENTIKLSRVIFLINVFIVLIYAIGGKFLIVLFFKNEFLESFDLLLFLLPGILFFGSGAIIYSYYMSIGYPNKVIILNLIFALISIVLNTIMIKYYQNIGASLAVSITFIIWTISIMIYFITENNINFLDLVLIKAEDIKYILNIKNKR